MNKKKNKKNQNKNKNKNNQNKNSLRIVEVRQIKKQASPNQSS